VAYPNLFGGAPFKPGVGLGGVVREPSPPARPGRGLQSSAIMRMSHAQILWFTLLSLGIPLFILWQIRRMKKADRFVWVAMILMLLTFLIVDAGLWYQAW
jgi:hypothetical protein